MTKAEYINLSRQARNSLRSLTKQAMTKLHKIYIEAGRLAAAQVRKAELAGLSNLTIESWGLIEKQLGDGAQKIMKAIEKQTYAVLNSGVGLTNNIHEDFINDAISAAGITNKISPQAVKALYRSINDYIIQSVVNRVWQDGYTFSTRIWRAGMEYQNQIRMVISTGLAQGRDPIKIAKDLQIYIADGKKKLANRYGPNLVRPAKEFMKRIGNTVDWRALRIVRSELYASLQDAAIQQGMANPGALNSYDWVLEKGRQHWNCECPDIASDGPYKYENVPGYPHANCRCQIRAVMRNTKEFVSDLKRWGDGYSVDYLDEWYRQNQYKFSA
jgi:hypothetical protein